LFHFQEEGPRRGVLAPEGLDRLPGTDRLYAAGAWRAITAKVNAPQILDKALWETSGHWDWYRENMFAAQSAGDEAEDKRWFVLKAE